MKKDKRQKKFDKCPDKSNVKKHEHVPSLGLKKVEGSDVIYGQPQEKRTPVHTNKHELNINKSVKTCLFE